MGVARKKFLKRSRRYYFSFFNTNSCKPKHGFEKWSNFPHEKERLLSLIKQFKKPVGLVSGDRHKAGIYKQDNLYELTSFSLNKPFLGGWGGLG
ncbi:MAG: hypothetical protein Ct9H300mP3_11850 [Gammaproteobacteria bacterium]|nr:MAG: hypothetical protein Ct9H300mP3_11850 [Gammaproteobacteria bacterium]